MEETNKIICLMIEKKDIVIKEINNYQDLLWENMVKIKNYEYDNYGFDDKYYLKSDFLNKLNIDLDLFYFNLNGEESWQMEEILNIMDGELNDIRNILSHYKSLSYYNGFEKTNQ